VITAEPDSDSRFCSVIYAAIELDECGAWVTLSCGGHPRPIVVRRSGWIDVRGQAGSLIGLFDVAFVDDDRIGLGPGDAIVFFTDGITESRDDTGAMFGEEALPAVLLDHAGASASEIGDAVLEASLAFSGGRRLDDVALLVVRVPDPGEDVGNEVADLPVSPATSGPTTTPSVGDEYAGLRNQRPSPPREARIQLPVDPRSAAAARRFVAGVLRSWRMLEVLDGDVELLVSELASNAVRHAQSAFTVVLRYDGTCVRVEVGDGSPLLPEVLPPTLDQTSGRGLFLVEAMSKSPIRLPA